MIAMMTELPAAPFHRAATGCRDPAAIAVPDMVRVQRVRLQPAAER